jgi:hypothetical protein
MEEFEKLVAESFQSDLLPPESGTEEQELVPAEPVPGDEATPEEAEAQPVQVGESRESNEEPRSGEADPAA